MGEEQSLRIERERWQAEQAAAEAKKRSNAKMAPYWALLLARGLGGLYKEDLEKLGGKYPAELEAFFAATEKQRTPRNGADDCEPEEILQADQTKGNRTEWFLRQDIHTMTLKTSTRPCDRNIQAGHRNHEPGISKPN